MYIYTYMYIHTCVYVDILCTNISLLHGKIDICTNIYYCTYRPQAPAPGVRPVLGLFSVCLLWVFLVFVVLLVFLVFLVFKD